MNTASLEKIKKLKADADALRKAITEYQEMTEKPKTYDKLQFEFGSGQCRGMSCGLTINHGIKLHNYSGTYGDSGVSPFLRDSVSGNLETVFFKALNKYRDAIIFEMASELENQAAELESQARKELEQLQEMLNSLNNGA